MEMTEKRSSAFASAKTEPAPAKVYVTVTGNPPRADQQEFKDFLASHLKRGYITFPIKGLNFEVYYADIEKGFIPPRSADDWDIRVLNYFRRIIRHSRYAPSFLKNFATHKVPTGFAMARVNVVAENNREIAGEWLNHFAQKRDAYPEKIPLQSFALYISPQDLYLKVQEFYSRSRK